MCSRGKKSEQLELGDIAADRVSNVIMPGSKILDVGGGSGRHSAFFSELGHDVTFNDYKLPEQHPGGVTYVLGDFMGVNLTGFDVAWVCHVLEHQLDVNAFLKKVASSVVDKGLIAISVPPAKSQVVSGHMTLWNAGLVLYNLVLAGLDCYQARILRHGYNISVLIRKKEIDLPQLKFDYGDLSLLQEFFPPGLERSGDSFNGEIYELNWY